MAVDNNNFLLLVEKAMAETDRSHMRPVIEKELLHYDILFALDKAGFLEKLVFQGGTSLRLCYGAQRFSEDLDFAGGTDFKREELISIKSYLEEYLGNRYGLEINVKEPKDFTQEELERRNINVNVSIWQIRIVTHPGKKDLPKQMIKIEVANIPAYTKEPKLLKHNYDFLPDGYSDTIIMVESLDEILADKVVAFVSSKRPRHRDIWDIHWIKQQGGIIRMDLVKNKIKDYKINKDDYEKKLVDITNNLRDIIFGKEFREQMSRFLPSKLQERTISNERFLDLLVDETYEMLNELGFEWIEKSTGELFCTNSLKKLTGMSFEETMIRANKTTDKQGSMITYGKRSKQLIVSPSNEAIARKLSRESIYKSSLPKGYQIDASLKPDQWFIKFVNNQQIF